MKFKQIFRSCTAIFIAAILAIAACGCEDLGDYSSVEEYYSSFGDVVLISGTNKEEQRYAVEKYFYNEDSREDFLENEEIQTYVSFSVDVTYAAQKVFLDILGDNGFKVKESVARISHLALELSSKKGILKNAKSILAVIACNENLRYVVYKQAKDVFVRQTNEGVLRGYGTDLRGRALLEQIVWQINNSSKFLKKEEEEFEIIRLSQNLERWLLQLDNTKYGRPVVYNDITFSRAPHNKQSATIIKNVIEDRTKAIVNVVVDNIIQYVKENKIMYE